MVHEQRQLCGDRLRPIGVPETTTNEVVWAEPMPAGTSAQKAELIALAKPLELGWGKKINVYTDGRYVFASAHVHGAIYKERGLLTAEGKTLKGKNDIWDLLKALWGYQKLTIIHWPSHQKGDGAIQKGNSLLIEQPGRWQ